MIAKVEPVFDQHVDGVGRPDKITVDEKKEVWRAFEKYVDEEEYPTVTGFCANHKIAVKYGLISQNLKDWPQFSSLIKKANDKQAIYTEEQTIRGKMNPTWAIFKLKQPAFGWTDKQEVEHSGKLSIESSYNPEIKQEFEQFLKAKDVIDVTPNAISEHSD